ncbi:MAG: pre-peptidase C-terminal domain-containing protein [Chloroflexota bacterium]
MSIQTNENSQAKPVIFLAFANPTAGARGYLRNLGEEARQLENAIRQAQVDNLCELVVKPYASLAEILDVFRQYRDRIAIFHYAGHAKNFMLLLEDSSRNIGDNKNKGANSGTVLIDGRGLATFLGEQNGLQLVFLNACSTQPQVDELLNANVPAVVATSQSIRDDIATALATHFYQSLTSGANLQKAFNEAEGVAQAMVGKDNTRDIHFDDDIENETSEMADFNDLPWRLTIKSGAEEISEWSLAEAANEPLFGLPLLPEYDLPEQPFRHLNFFTVEDAEIFFGRGHQIRHLYDLVTTPDSAPIILFYGESGVGKSSMLAAGFLPRLQHHTIHYVRRDQALGLTETLTQTLWAEESLPQSLDVETIVNRWHELEQQPDGADTKPLIIILDQVEEIFTRPNSEQPQELADFLAVLNALFAQRSQRPQGKLILGFRKEWLADIEDAMKAQRLPRAKLFLARLNRAGIMEAVTGVARSTRLQTRYHLSVESGLAEIIADDLLEDPDSPVAPTLQILLTKMWSQATMVNHDQPMFDIALYQSLKREGLLLSDFLQQQLDKLYEWRAEVVDSGLALDVLAAHTTSQGTVNHYTETKLLEMYHHLKSDIPALVQKCEELYLLFNPSKHQTNQPKASRLAHDALASLTRQRYEESDKPGQRARRILDTRVAEWVDEDGELMEGNPLDEGDLGLVEAGLTGTRHLTPLEQQLLHASRDAQARRERERKRQRRIRRGLVVLVMVAAVVSFFLWQQSDDLRRVADAQREDAEVLQKEAEEQRAIAVEHSKSAEEQRFEAETQTTKAEAQTELAQAQSRRALSENLASQSRLLIQTAQERGDLPLILARDAVLLDPSANANQALYLALTHQRWQRTLPTVNHHQGSIATLVFSPDQKSIASGGYDGTIRLWSIDNMDQPTILFGHADWVTSISYSPDGTTIVSGSDDKTVRVWNVASGQQIDQLDNHDDFVRAVSYSPDGKHIASAGWDNSIRVWDISKKKTVHKFYEEDGINTMVYSPDGAYLATGGYHNKLYIWDVENEEIVMEFSGHDDIIKSISYSPDGTHIASASNDHTVRIWDVGSGAEVLQFPMQTSPVRAVSYSPNGRHLIAGNRNGVVLVWDIETQEEVANFPGHTFGVNALSVSQDGQYIAVGSAENSVKIWDVIRKQAVFRSSSESSLVSTLSASPDGRTIASGGSDGMIRIWDSDTGQMIAQLAGHDGWVQSVSFSPDGTHLVSGGDDRIVRVWHVASGEEVTSLRGHSEVVTSVAYSPDGALIVSGGRDDTIRLWNIDSDEEIAQFTGHSNAVQTVSYSPDGTHIASGSFDKTIRIWDIANRKEIARFEGHTDIVWSVAYSPDGTQLASSSRDHTVRIWDIEKNADKRIDANTGTNTGTDTGTNTGTDTYISTSATILARHRGEVYTVMYSPDGRYIVSGGDEAIRLWDAAKAEQVARLSGHEAKVRAVAYSADGKSIVSGSYDSTIRIWDARTAQTSTTFSRHSDDVNAIVHSPDGVHIASGSADHTVRVWNRVNGTQLSRLSGHTNTVNAIAYSPDGRHIVSGGDDNTIYIWDVSSGEEILHFPGRSGDINTVAYSPDGAYIVSGSDDTTVRIWNAANGEEVAQLVGHTHEVSSVAYHPKGTHIVSGSSDNTVKIWDVASGEAIATLSDHTDRVRSVAYSPDGTQIASGGNDNVVRVWDVASQKQVGVFAGHSNHITSVSYRFDGLYIISSSRDTTVRVWDVTRGKEVAQFSRHSGVVNTSQFSPDGLYAVFDSEGTIYTLPTPAVGILQTVAKIPRSGPILTTVELQRFGVDMAEILPDQADLKPLITEAQAYALIEEGEDLAWAGDIERATQQFEAALDTIAPLQADDAITLTLPSVYELAPPKKAAQLAAVSLLAEASLLARAGTIERAIHKFAGAVALVPDLSIEPEIEAKRIYALVHQGDGRRLAKTGKIISATLKFEAAMALDPSLTIEPASEAKRLAGFALLDQSWTDAHDPDNTRSLLNELTDQLPPFTVGRPVTATTASTAYWHFTGSAGQLATISMIDTENGNFDPRLTLIGPDGTIIRQDDDSGGGFNGGDAFIQNAVLPETGTYFVVAGRPNSDVVYELTVTLQSDGVPIPQPTTLLTQLQRAQVLHVEDNITEASTLLDELLLQTPLLMLDTPETTATDQVYLWRFYGRADQVVTFSLTNTEDQYFDPQLTLIGPNGALIAKDDDSGGGQLGLGALIADVTLPAHGVYFVLAGRAGSDVVYELVVHESTMIDDE